MCGKCRVQINPPENCSSLTDAELEILSESEVAAGIRLACQAYATDKIEVVVPEGSVETDSDTAKTITTSTFEVSPMVRREVITPTFHDSDVRSSLGSILKDVLPQLRYDISLEPGDLQGTSSPFYRNTSVDFGCPQGKGYNRCIAGLSRQESRVQCGFRVLLHWRDISATLEREQYFLLAVLRTRKWNTAQMLSRGLLSHLKPPAALNGCNDL